MFRSPRRSFWQLLLAAAVLHAAVTVADSNSTKVFPMHEWDLPLDVRATSDYDAQKGDPELSLNWDVNLARRSVDAVGKSPKMSLNWIHRQAGEWIYGSEIDLDNDDNDGKPAVPIARRHLALDQVAFQDVAQAAQPGAQTTYGPQTAAPMRRRRRPGCKKRPSRQTPPMPPVRKYAPIDPPARQPQPTLPSPPPTPPTQKPSPYIVSTPCPSPTPVSDPTSKPAPVSAPTPKPMPVFILAPKPAPVSAPAPKPMPVSVLAPKPAPVSVLSPKPAPKPTSPQPPVSTRPALPAYNSDKESWALSRIRRTSSELDEPAPELPSDGGKGTHIWMIDSGFDQQHSGEFALKPIIEIEYQPNAGRYDTQSGHGTQVASCVSSWKYGVAKAAQLHVVAIGAKGPLRKAVQFVIDRVKKMESARPSGGKRQIRHVLQMSVTFLEPGALDEEMRAADEAGIVVVNAAGNGADNACHYSPASFTRKTRNILTVGSIGNKDQISKFSARGSCVNIFAPGEQVSVLKANGAVKKSFGTSFSSPFTAGVVALYMSRRNYTSPGDVVDAVIANATPLGAYSNANQLPGVVYAFPRQY